MMKEKNNSSFCMIHEGMNIMCLEIFYMMRWYEFMKSIRWLETMVPMMKELCIEDPEEAICEELERRVHKICIYSHIR